MRILWLSNPPWCTSGYGTQTRVIVPRLRALGHTVDVVPAYDEVMGHAGAIVRHPDGSFEGGTDPRSDGAAIGW